MIVYNRKKKRIQAPTLALTILQIRVKHELCGTHLWVADERVCTIIGTSFCGCSKFFEVSLICDGIGRSIGNGIGRYRAPL